MLNHRVVRFELQLYFWKLFSKYLTALASTTTVITITDTLHPGQTLTTTSQPLVSKNGLYEFVVLPDGNVVVRSTSSGNVVLSSGSGGSGVTKATLNPDGSLELTNDKGDVIQTTKTFSSSVPGSQLMLMNNGDFIIFNGSEISFSSAAIGALSCGKTFKMYH